MAKHEEALRDLAMNDERFVESVLAIQLTNIEASNLDPKTHSLARLGALIALDAAPASYQWNIGMALAAGQWAWRVWCPRHPSSLWRSDTTSTRRSRPQAPRAIGVACEPLPPTAQRATGCARRVGDRGLVGDVARAPARRDGPVVTSREPERHGVDHWIGVRREEEADPRHLSRRAPPGAGAENENTEAEGCTCSKNGAVGQSGGPGSPRS
jgi:hypothetical protein